MLFFLHIWSGLFLIIFLSVTLAGFNNVIWSSNSEKRYNLKKLSLSPLNMMSNVVVSSSFKSALSLSCCCEFYKILFLNQLVWSDLFSMLHNWLCCSLMNFVSIGKRNVDCGYIQLYSDVQLYKVIHRCTVIYSEKLD